MQFRDSPREAAFRQEVREFIAREAPKVDGGSLEEALVDREALAALGGWWRRLADRGWIAPAWPREYGGAGMTVMEQFIFNEELARSRAPGPLHLIIGVAIAGPTIIALGTEEQRQRFLPGILSGLEIWCQGYSEPAAGSDLASLRTRAARDGDDWVINGQKIWTSLAHVARWMILLARTDHDAPKHKGITYFIADMKAPGVTVRPLVNMAGGHEFNEVFFEDVRVPSENIIGEVNRGWYGAVTTLDLERSSIGSAVGQQQAVEDLAAYARRDPARSRADKSVLRHELADRTVEAEVAMALSYRVVSMQHRGLIPNYEASVTKLYSSELNQRIARTAMKVLGLHGQLDKATGRWAPLRGRWKYEYLRSVANTIEGGTSEVQRNIIATRGLGLPRE